MIPKIAIRTTGQKLSEAVRDITEQVESDEEARIIAVNEMRENYWDHLSPLQQAQLRATRPDLFWGGEEK